MRKLFGLGALFIWLSVTGVGQATLTIYYLRHGEAGHNAVKQFVQSGTPTNQWPAYVGNPNVFTPAGEAQVQGVATKLLPQQFDLVAVSPLWRTRHTILPYLQATGRMAEIWPELVETKHFDFSPDLVIPQLVTGAQALELPLEEQAFFHLRADREGCCALLATNSAAAFGLAKQTVDRLRTRFGTNDVTVLLVGHGTAGETLIRHLTRNQAWSGRIKNAALWMAREQPGGAFELIMFNDAPYPPSR